MKTRLAIWIFNNVFYFSLPKTSIHHFRLLLSLSRLLIQLTKGKNKLISSQSCLFSPLKEVRWWCLCASEVYKWLEMRRKRVLIASAYNFVFGFLLETAEGKIDKYLPCSAYWNESHYQLANGKCAWFRYKKVLGWRFIISHDNESKSFCSFRRFLLNEKFNFLRVECFSVRIWNRSESR